MRLQHRSLALLCLLAMAPMHAAEPNRSTGPVFDQFGAAFDNVEPTYMPPVEDYRLIFDIWVGPEQKDQPNPRLDTLARFMNYNARAGIAVENMHLAVVLHGTAGKALLSDAAYRKRFGVANPDQPLLDALASKGVRMLICGQSAASRGYANKDLIPAAEVAVSAYTAILGLQEEGYRMMPSWQ